MKRIVNPEVVETTVGLMLSERSIGTRISPPPVPRVPALIPERKEKKLNLFIVSFEILY